MKFVNYVIIVIITAGVYACGDPAVEIEEVVYEPKIVVEGYLYPGETVDKIKLSRNFPLETAIDSANIVLSPGRNSVYAAIDGTPLKYDELNGWYFNENILIENDKSYNLEVSAVIDDKQFYTESTTITPKQGFRILEKDLGNIKYIQERANIRFNPAPGTGFYAFSIRAENASLDNFIYNNPFFPNQERKDIEENFNDFLFQFNLVININSVEDNIFEYEINELDTWFYSDYKVIVYAGDENFKDYLLTVNRVQQPDGNFIEPEFHFNGDGIGVFGSAVKDTVVFNLVSF